MFSVDIESCTGCGECVDACPRHAISLVQNTACIDPGMCDECGTCFRLCPHGAVYQSSALPERRSSVTLVPDIDRNRECLPGIASRSLTRRPEGILPVAGATLAGLVPLFLEGLVGAIRRLGRGSRGRTGADLPARGFTTPGTSHRHRWHGGRP